MTITPALLSAALAAVCPLDGVNGPADGPVPWATYPASDGSRWRVDFRPEATDAQRHAAIAALASYVDPPPVPQVTSKQVLYALNHLGVRTQWDTAWTAQKQDDRDWFGLGGDPFPVNHKRILRLLGAAGVDAGKVLAQAQQE